MNHLIDKTNDDLNKAIESNFEDTTLGKKIQFELSIIPSLLAVVTLRKDLSETMKEESKRTMQIKEDMNSNIENLKEEFRMEIDKNNQINEKKNVELLQKFRENENNLESLKQNLESSERRSKDELQNAISILGLSGF